MCRYSNSEDCSDVDDGSGDGCDYADYRICIKKQGKY